MKFYPTTLGINVEICNVIVSHFFGQIDISNIEDSDYVALFITNINKWELNINEFNLIKNKPFVIFDYSEYGHDSKNIPHFFGENTDLYLDRINEKKFVDLDKALRNVKIKCYFKRELPKDISIKTYYPIYPIEYPSVDLINYKIDSLEEYNKRPIDIFFNWGWSNPSRPKLHAAFYELAEKFNYRIISNHLHLVNEKKENPNSILIYSSYSPHHSRLDINSILELQKISKISISLNGCGVKCFRHSESSFNSLMALQENDLEWTYKWDDENAIVLPNINNSLLIDSDKSIEKMLNLINEGNLYERYLKCVKTNIIYNKKTYINELLKRI